MKEEKLKRENMALRIQLMAAKNHIRTQEAIWKSTFQELSVSTFLL